MLDQKQTYTKREIYFVGFVAESKKTKEHPNRGKEYCQKEKVDFRHALTMRHTLGFIPPH